tara:strand:+ start:78 stop:689 length:612 start_codon:yes stop_codon:yes gene_type:complete
MNVIEHWDLAVKSLSKTDSIMKGIVETYKGEKMKLRNAPFETLARSIVGQQISVKAADSVWKKLDDLCQNQIEKEKILNLSHDQLRSAGLSNQKATYLRNIAESNIFETEWNKISDEEAIETLCTIKGVGVWTAEMFLIFHLAKPNILPLGDIGLIKGIEINYNDGKKMEKRKLETFREKWNPWCTVATWYLWRSLDPIPVEY